MHFRGSGGIKKKKELIFHFFKAFKIRYEKFVIFVTKIKNSQINFDSKILTIFGY